MRKIPTFLLCLLLSSFSFGKETKPLKINPLTAGKIEVILKEVEGKSKPEVEELIASSLVEDKAVLNFSETIHDLCLDPAKYDFPTSQEARDCNRSEIQAQVIKDLAFGVVEKNAQKSDAVLVERELNELLNTYIDKYRAIVKTFAEWVK